MSIRCVCEHCGAAMKIKDELAGRKGHCPKCKAEFQIPPRASAPPQEAAAESDEYALGLPAADRPEHAAPTAPLPDFPGNPDDDAPRGKKSGRRAQGARKPARDDFDPNDPFASLDELDDEFPRQQGGKKKNPRIQDEEHLADDDPFADTFPAPATEHLESAPDESGFDEPTEDWEDFDETPSKKKGRSLPGAKGSAATVADDFMRSFAGSGADDLGEEEAPQKKKRRIFGGGGEDKGLSDGKFELADLLMFGLTRAVPILVGISCVVWLVYVGASRMIGDSFVLPPLGEVTGQVTFDGAALRGATVMFQPIGERGETVRKSGSVAITDDSGMYRLTYMTDVYGAAVGKHRVEIRARNANSQEVLPQRYNVRTELVREVEAGSNRIDFPLDSKPRG